MVNSRMILTSVKQKWVQVKYKQQGTDESKKHI